MSPNKNLKVLTISILLISVLVLTGCQPTPENTPIIQKDNFEGLVEKTAQSDSGELQQIIIDGDHITWQQKYTKEYPGAPSTEITVSVDAEIDARQNTASVFLVEPDEYDLDFAQKAVNYFMGDEFYEVVFTKDDLMSMMLPYKQIIENTDDINLKDNAENQMYLFERQYDSAPMNNNPGKIEFIKSDLFDYIGLKGYPYNGAISELYVTNGGKMHTNFYYVVQDTNKYYKDSNQRYSGTPARNMETSYEDAKKIAEDAVNKFYGETMGLVETYLYNKYGTSERVQGQYDSGDQCYMFVFTPDYGGLPQLYAPEARNEDDATNEGIPMYEQKWDHEYSMKWPAQYVEVLIDDDGIAQFWGLSHTKVTETVNDNVEMLSFNEIFETFKKDIFYSSVWSYPGLRTVDIRIDKIIFGMIRVPVRDNPDTYYMIPAWQFAGSKEENSGNGSYMESGKTFLVLNALDGSIIDTSYYLDVRETLEKTIGLKQG